jgi:hypothetical protein
MAPGSAKRRDAATAAARTLAKRTAASDSVRGMRASRHGPPRDDGTGRSGAVPRSRITVQRWPRLIRAGDGLRARITAQSAVALPAIG